MVPFPFSVLISIIAIPALLMAAAASIPVGLLRRHLDRKQEMRVASKLQGQGRLVNWSEAATFAHRREGTFIKEYCSLKGPYRLWWTPDDLPSAAPVPCCFTADPWDHEHLTELAEWCGRFTDAVNGTACLVELTGVADADIARTLEALQESQRCVSVGHHPPARSRYLNFS